MEPERKTNRAPQHVEPTQPIVTAAEIESAFRKAVKSHRCPGCELEFTDAAVDWGHAWCEGRHDLLVEQGCTERDGPFKLKCELCGHKSWCDYFDGSVAPVTQAVDELTLLHAWHERHRGRTKVAWKQVRERVGVGDRVTGRVISRHPFGVFVDIGLPLAALLLVVEMRDARKRRMGLEDYPQVGQSLDAWILALHDDRNEISLTQNDVVAAHIRSTT